METILFLLPLLLYFITLIIVSWRSSRVVHGDDGDYFLAGRSISKFSSFMSVMATETSVASIIVFPAAGYSSGWIIMWLALGFIAGRFIVANYYLETLYNIPGLSIYEDMVGGKPVPSIILSLFYLLAKYISSGVRFYLGGYALSHMFVGSTEIWMIVIASIVGIYSVTGGLRAVVMTDQIQGWVILGMGILFTILLSFTIANSTDTLLTLPAMIDLDFSPTNASFIPALFLGGMVLTIGSHGADQDMIQRVLAVRNVKDAKASLILSGFAASLVIFLYLTVGHLLKLTGIALDQKSPLVDYVSKIDAPFLQGLFAVLLIAAAMSTLDSAMHSTGAVWKRVVRRDIRARIYSFLSLIILLLFGLSFIFLSREHADFMSLALGSMNYVNGGLIAIITLYIFFPHRMNISEVILALVSGLLTTVYTFHISNPPIAWPWTTILSAFIAFVTAGGAGYARSIMGAFRE